MKEITIPKEDQRSDREEEEDLCLLLRVPHHKPAILA